MAIGGIVVAVIAIVTSHVGLMLLHGKSMYLLGLKHGRERERVGVSEECDR